MVSCDGPSRLFSSVTKNSVRQRAVVVKVEINEIEWNAPLGGSRLELTSFESLFLMCPGDFIIKDKGRILWKCGPFSSCHGRLFVFKRGTWHVFHAS